MQGDVIASLPLDDGDASVVEWCPVATCLVLGFSNGRILHLHVEARTSASTVGTHSAASKATTSWTISSHELKSAHTGSSITLLKWSPDGTRLLSGDSSGCVCLWKHDLRAPPSAYTTDQTSAPPTRLTQAAVLKRSGSIISATFLTYPGSDANVLPPSGFEPPASAVSGSDGRPPPLPPLAGAGACPCSLLFGADNGVVAYLDEESRTVDVLPGLHSPVDVLQFCPSPFANNSRPLSQAGAGKGNPDPLGAAFGPVVGRIVVITRSLQMVQLGVYGDGRLVLLSKSKLGLRAGGSVRSHVYIPAAGLIATCSTEEPLVRLWDVSGPLDEPEHASLLSTIAGRTIPKAERPQCIAFDATSSLLAIGTDSGHAYVWRQAGGRSWEPVATVGTGSGIESLSWAPLASRLPSPGVGQANAGLASAASVPFLAARLATGDVALLQEASLFRKLAAPLLASQQSSHEVCVERITPPPAGQASEGRQWGGPATHWCFSVRMSAPIRGLDVCPKAVLVWTSTEAFIYYPPETASQNNDLKSHQGLGPEGVPVLQPISSFRIHSPDMCITNDSVVTISSSGSGVGGATYAGHPSSSATGPAILVHNHAGVVKATVPVTDDSGVPYRLCSSGNGRYIAAATEAGHMLVYDLGRADPVLLGTGIFEAQADIGQAAVSLGRITALSLSADGGRLAILSARPCGVAPVPTGAQLLARKAIEEAEEKMRHESPVGKGGARGPTHAGRPSATSSKASSKGVGGVGTGAGASGMLSSSSSSSSLLPDTRLYVYSLDTDRICWWECGPRMRPVSVAWDVSESKLLSVQTERVHDNVSSSGGRGALLGSSQGSRPAGGSPGPGKERSPTPGETSSVQSASRKGADREVLTLWSAPEGAAVTGTGTGGDGQASDGDSGAAGPGAPLGVSDSLVLADSFTLEAPADAYLGTAAPHVATLLLPSAVAAGGSRVGLTWLRDFAGLESIGSATGALCKGLPWESVVPAKDGVPVTASGKPGSSSASASRKALMEFSYQSACGNMDGAYAAVRALLATLSAAESGQAPDMGGMAFQVWSNLAASCVRSHRLDVAVVCLGHLGHARGAKALKELGDLAGGDDIARSGILATQLGLLKEAAMAFQQGKRFDLLAQLYADSGAWDRALSVARVQDRIHARTMAYEHARYLERCGQIEGAASAYEAAGAGAREVPRMLFETAKASRQAADWRALEVYVEAKCKEAEEQRVKAGQPAALPGASNADASGAAASSSWADSLSPLQGVCLPSWYGQFLEARGDVEAAMAWYERAGDATALVRVGVTHGDLEGAKRAAEKRGDPAAAYSLARALEAQGDLASALHFYGLSGRVGHAIRLAVASGMDAEIQSLALRANDAKTQLEAASFLEHKGGKQAIERAAQLYAKAGSLEKAVGVCMAHGLSDLLPSIVNSALEAAEGGSESQPGPSAGARSTQQVALLCKLAEHFSTSGQYGRAAEMYIRAGRLEPALELCITHRLPVDETLAEQLTPPDVPDGLPEAEADTLRQARSSQLTKLAKALLKGGQWHLAAKKFTQAGDKVRAIKALLQSGDTEKIIFFAQVSRSKEIYILAANYLQSLAWQTDGDVLRTIIDFYSKAKANEHLR